MEKFDPSELVAPLEEEIEPIKITEDKVIIAGIEIHRNKERSELVPNAENFKDFILDKFSFDMLKRIAKAIALDQPILIEGEAATGKSYTVEYLAHLANMPVYRMSMNGQTDVTDLIGKWVPRTDTLRKRMEDLLKNPEKAKNHDVRKLIEAKIRIKPVSTDEIAPEKEKEMVGLTREEMEMIALKEGIDVPEGEWTWQDGDIPRQMESGAWSVLDEVNTSEPQVLVRLNRPMERGGDLVLHEDGSRKVTRHKNFRLVATVNPPGGRYKGRVPLSAEWISRWNYQNVGSLPSETRAERMMAAEGVPLEEEMTVDVALFEPESELKPEEKLSDYYEADWIKDLFLKYAIFADSVQKLIVKREIAKDQKQTFDFDQRDDQRFREYLRKFRRSGDMKGVIQEALEYIFMNKLTKAEDRKKVQDAADLNKVDEPKEKIPTGDKAMEKRLRAMKAGLLGVGMAEDHEDAMLGK